MKKYTLDTGVILLVLSGRPALRWLVEEIDNGNTLTTRLNLFEMVYLIGRKHGWDAAITQYRRLTTTNIEVADTTEELMVAAARLKTKYSELSTVDSFVAALTQLTHSTLLTTEEYLAGVKEVEAKKVDY